MESIDYEFLNTIMGHNTQRFCYQGLVITPHDSNHEIPGSIADIMEIFQQGKVSTATMIWAFRFEGLPI
jgi:hypothetical protein